MDSSDQSKATAKTWRLPSSLPNSLSSTLEREQATLDLIAHRGEPFVHKFSALIASQYDQLGM